MRIEELFKFLVPIIILICPQEGKLFYFSFLLLTCGVVVFLLKNNFKFQMFEGVVSVFLFLCVFFILGYENKAIHFEVFRYLYYCVFLIFLIYSFKCKNDLNHLLGCASIIVGLIYILIFLDVIPNIYLKEDLVIKKERVFGPILIAPISYMFFLIKLKKLKFSKFVLISICFGGIAIVLNGSLQYISIFFILLFFLIYPYIFSLKVLLTFLSAGLFLLFFNLSSLNRLSFLMNPMDSPTFLARIYDLGYVFKFDNFRSILFGDKFGVTTVSNRIVNFQYTGKREFLEIDNGFYYLYHRLGLVGMFGYFIVWRRTLFLNIESLSYSLVLSFIVIFFITNLLSINFFTYPSVAIYTFILLINFHEK